MIDLTFRRYDAAGSRRIRSIVELVYRDSYTRAIESGVPFDSPEAFMGRFDAFTSYDMLDHVVAYEGDEPVGQIWGWPRDEKATREWWAGLAVDSGCDFAPGEGERMFVLSEIMVRSRWVGQGVAHALHDELLSTRPEQFADLFVEPDDDVAYRAYRHWGWRRVAQHRPGWPDAPLFDVLILPLPLTVR